MTLGAVFALRLLGIFLILPVFSVWAQTLEGGSNAFMVGLALGVYGLTQAVLQIPFGAASDRFGRKPVIVTGLLIFIFGSLLAYTANDITTLLFARALQGAGAVSAAVTAMISDSVRDKLLTRAMAFVGASIGISFTFSLVLAPVLADSIGVPGIFLLTAVLCVLAIAAVLMLPTAPVKRFEDFQARARLRDVFLHGQLMRLNLGMHGDDINAGVLMIHVDNMRKYVDAETIFRYIDKKGKTLFQADQDVINALFKNKIISINPCFYNLDEATYRRKGLDLEWVRRNAVFVHYNGKNKPWKENYRGELNVFWNQEKERQAAVKGFEAAV